MNYLDQIECPQCKYMIDKNSWGTPGMVRDVFEAERNPWKYKCPRCNYKIYTDELIAWERKHGWYMWNEESAKQEELSRTCSELLKRNNQ